MALVKKKVNLIKWPITITSPSDGGKWVDESFIGIFKKIGLTKLNELAEQGDPKLVKSVMEGWEEIKDEEGNEVTFNKKELDSFLDDPHFLRATVQAVLEMTQEAPSKN